MAIEFYKEFGEYGYLANYSDYGFIKNNIYYRTAEHYYQSLKFDDKKIQNKIIAVKTPKEASTIGRDRSLKRKEDFRKIKLDIMYEGVLEKFRQNSTIRSKLIETRNQEIREMTVKESFWGVGPNLDGENHSGKILMKVREVLKKELLEKIIENCKNKKVYILGHKNPDVDSVFSSLILSRILKKLNINACFAVRDENFIGEKIINDYLEEKYEVINDYKNKYFLLVDHNNLDGIENHYVLGAIDHHRITGEIENLIEIEYASTGLLIYDLFKDIYSFSDKELLLIGLTVLTDTDYLVSSRFSNEDLVLYKELKLNIDCKELQKKYFETTNFLESISFNLKKDYKEYVIDNKIIKRSLIVSYTGDKENYYDIYINSLEKNSIDLLIWCDYEAIKTYVFYKNIDLILPFFTTSTNLVFDYLKSKNYL